MRPSGPIRAGAFYTDARVSDEQTILSLNTETRTADLVLDGIFGGFSTEPDAVDAGAVRIRAVDTVETADAGML